MRLFVGVELLASIAAAAEAAAGTLRARLEKARVRLDARWVPRENLHITLWFLGQVRDEAVGSLQASLSAPFETRAFDLHIAGAGAFPASGPPRVLWFGIREGHEELSALHRELVPRLAPLGFEPERRPYSAHLTVARVKEAPRGAREAVDRTLQAHEADLQPFRVSFATVFRSHLSPSGSRYEAMLRIPLG